MVKARFLPLGSWPEAFEPADTAGFVALSLASLRFRLGCVGATSSPDFAGCCCRRVLLGALSTLGTVSLSILRTNPAAAAPGPGRWGRPPPAHAGTIYGCRQITTVGSLKFCSSHESLAVVRNSLSLIGLVPGPSPRLGLGQLEPLARDR